jgi:hypothetical protein
MKAQEVRLGNYYFYHIVDKYDERGEYDEVCQIDAEDFRILESFDCPEYKPIPLDEEWLLKFGFTKRRATYLYYKKDGVELFYVKGKKRDAHHLNGFYYENFLPLLPVDYLHQLQNLYFALTGKELEIKS